MNKLTLIERLEIINPRLTSEYKERQKYKIVEAKLKELKR